MTEDAGKRKVMGGFWKSMAGKLTLGGLFSAALAMVAGFMSPEVRTLACLDLPKDSELAYPQVESETPYELLASQSQQASFDGKAVTFRARVYGEYGKAVLGSILPGKYKEYSIGHIRGIRDEPSAMELQDFPDVALLLGPELAREWTLLPRGSVVEVTGNAVFLSDFPADSRSGAMIAQARAMAARSSSAMPAFVQPVPEYADFYVVAKGVRKLTALNDPKNRLMCKWRKL